MAVPALLVIMVDVGTGQFGRAPHPFSMTRQAIIPSENRMGDLGRQREKLRHVTPRHVRDALQGALLPEEVVRELRHAVEILLVRGQRERFTAGATVALCCRRSRSAAELKGIGGRR